MNAGNTRSRVHAVIVSEDAIVGFGWRLTQLSLTPAPSLLSTSASEPFSDASCSCSEDGTESTVSLATTTVADAGVGATGGVGKGRGGKGRDTGAGAGVGADGNSAVVAGGDVGGGARSG